MMDMNKFDSFDKKCKKGYVTSKLCCELKACCAFQIPSIFKRMLELESERWT